MADPIKTARAYKREHATFPLTIHKGALQWCKKHKGRTFYFGRLSDPVSAKKRYEQEWEYVVEGKTPPATPGGVALTLRDLCNAFLRSRRYRMAAGELTSLSYRDYFRTCELLVSHWGKTKRVDSLRPIDFEGLRAKLAAKYGVTTLLGCVNRIRVILKYASDQELIPQPVRYGQSFDRPSKKRQRRIRNQTEARQFTRDELLRILDSLADDPQLRAMTLLALNAGLGVTDCAELRESHLDLDRGWLDYPRVKTETPRRAPLWDETRDALRIVLAQRNQPRDPADAGIVFLTRTRQRWVRTRLSAEGTPEKNLHLNALSQAFGKVLKSLSINGRDRLNFYSLRRTFEIQAGGCRDQVAVDFIMGHVDPSMAATYRQNVIDDDRLRSVTDHVHAWLLGNNEGGAK